jgi:hypothetical protein
MKERAVSRSTTQRCEAGGCGLAAIIANCRSSFELILYATVL